MNKSKRVYLDYTRNPTGFDFEKLNKEAADYLLAAGNFGIARPRGSALNDTQVSALLCAAHIAKKQNREAFNDSALDNYGYRHKSLSNYFYDKDMLISAKALLETIIFEMSKTGSRGGAVFIDHSQPVKENRDYRKYLTISRSEDVYFEKVSSVPKPDKAFEKYLENT